MSDSRYESERLLGRREFVGFAVGAFVVSALPFARSRRAEVVRRTAPVMGTIAEFAVLHRDTARAHAAMDAAMAELRTVERLMTRFSDHSDIGRANRLAWNTAVPVSPATALVTTEALRWARALDGRYDPAVGSVVRLWDVTHRHEPPPDEPVSRLAARRFHREVEVATQNGIPIIRYHDEEAQLDLGSIAKGYGVDRAVSALRDNGVDKALVVVGGDLYALGTGPGNDPWRIGIQSPTDRRKMAGFLDVTDKAVATSGTYQQFFDHAGKRYHHLMDPLTARPRTTSMQSLTIIADSVMHADVAATALYGLAPSEIDGALAAHLPDAQVASRL
jgi:FAD:protein FMN transferase